MSFDEVSRLEQAIDLAEMSHNVSLDGVRAAIEQHLAEAVRERVRGAGGGGGYGMSTLREAAQAALTAYEKFRDVDDIDGLDDAMDRLRSAVAQPETEAEPVAWEARWIDPEEGASYWVPTQNPDFYRSCPNYEVRPLYTHPPRDEWRPEDGRRYRYLKSFCSPMGLDADNNHPWTCRINPSRMRGASVDEALDAAMERDGWRDVTSPMEAPIAAKCQRIEGSGEICGLTPPCPDCGSSLIDVPEGSL